MSSAHASEMLRMSTQLFVATLGGWLVLAMLMGRVRLSGLLLHGGAVSAVQLQLLLTTVVVSFEYAMAVAHTTSLRRLPPLDDTWLTLAVGSNGLFLARGLLSRFVNQGPGAR